MYELKRSELLKVEVKIGDEIITTNLNLSKHARESLKLIRELEIIRVNLDNEKDIENNLIKLGEITIKLVQIFFGENADKVLKFYSDESDDSNIRNVSFENTEELLIEIMPFLFSLTPQIQDFNKRKQEELNKSIKSRKVV